MANNQTTTVNEAVHKLQLALLEGIQDQNQLLAAGSLMSQSDYNDVVMERSITNMCGYPLCGNCLPSERPWKGRYRISLKEHKVYDLQETYMYCSTGCVVNGHAFSVSLPNERCFTFNIARINEILSFFKDASFDLEEERDMERGVNLGLLKLKIQEHIETECKVMSLEWAGPSNAIEGYVPRRNQNPKLLSLGTDKKGSEFSNTKLNKDRGGAIEEIGFKSVILADEECTVSKNMPYDGEDELLPSETTKPLPNQSDFKSTIIVNDKFTGSKKQLRNVHESKNSSQKKGKDTTLINMDFMSTIITQDEYTVSKAPAEASKNDSNWMPKVAIGKASCSTAGDKCKELENSSSYVHNDPGRSLIDSRRPRNGTSLDDKLGLAETKMSSAYEQLDQPIIRSSLKSSSTKKKDRTVTWADEKSNGASGSNLCEFSKTNCTGFPSETLPRAGSGEDDADQFASANACASALTQAVSEHGIVLMPQPCDAVESGSKYPDEDGPMMSELASVKWPKKSNIREIDAFDTEDSWFDSLPDGFSLTLSPFASMWDLVFTWITSSSLAYIYGKDDSYQEEYLYVNGREYPRKIVLSDGRSSEIKQTMAGCLARALPGVISDLKLATPISTLEQRMACLLDTLSFLEALPSFRMKQWQVIVLLFVDALSVCRIPGLAPQLSSKRVSMLKVLEGAKMGMAEYESLRDIVLPCSGA